MKAFEDSDEESEKVQEKSEIPVENIDETDNIQLESEKIDNFSEGFDTEIASAPLFTTQELLKPAELTQDFFSSDLISSSERFTDDLVSTQPCKLSTDDIDQILLLIDNFFTSIN